MLTKEPLSKLMQESAEIHKRFHTRNRKEAREQIVMVATVLKHRREVDK